MLETLFGSKTIQKILIFMLVNGKCYGTQLHLQLRTSLTPIQKALARLERGGIIMSHYEGKTRIYQFNPSFLLLDELELLLKKAYSLLPSNEKKNYYIDREERLPKQGNQENGLKVLLSFWEKLIGVRQLMFNAKTKSKDATGWNGKGKGEVLVTKEGHTMLIFSEKGSWQGDKGGEMAFSNVFRWTLDRNAGVISLEHLRRGIDHPVFLFHLVPSGNHSLSSVDSHMCAEDAYFGRIHLDRYGLRLNWRVIGPQKNEEINYLYY